MAADTIDVLIVGAGPTGLLLAGDLAAAGVPVTVLERRQGDSDPSRACVVHARTLELLDARGIADDLIDRGRTLDHLNLFGQITVDLARLPSRFGFALVTPQYQTERLLAERARSLGAQIIEGMEVTALRPANEGAHVQASGTAGKCRTFTPSFVVGADGARSTVRDMMSLPFIPADQAEIVEVIRKVLGSEIATAAARWLARYQGDERQAPRYRSGPVFLAGDAAHAQSPAGGHGVNPGLQDAANLSWKLAAVARRTASPILLDSYQDERHPSGKAALRISRNLPALTLFGHHLTQLTDRAAAEPPEQARAIADRVAEAVSGIGAGYLNTHGAHRLTGRRAPDLPLTGAGPRRLYEALREGKFILLDGEPQDDPMSYTANRWRERVLTAAPRAPQALLCLIRPDGYVAWATDLTDDASRSDALRRELIRWCGAAAPAPLTATSR
jgi:2-polyprenyl-6-methoxyphenol hydroxylase-like FAD-dependent oxidoreductase